MKSSLIAKLQVISSPILALLIINQGITGLIGADRIESLGGEHAYAIWHVFPGYFLVLLIVLHVFLNWGWVKMHYFNKKEK